MLQPDILAIPAATWPYDPKVTDTPVLAVEVLCPSTSRRDSTKTFDAYARFGVGQNWIADPGRAGRPPTVTVYDLDGDHYRQVAQASGAQQLTLVHPLALTVIPDALAGATRRAALFGRRHTLAQRSYPAGQGPSPKPGVWPTNAHGQTYGSDADANAQTGEPDLIAAYATNGRQGYVARTDVDGPMPTSISQALAQNTAPARTIPVYLSDGSPRSGCS